MSNRDKAVNKLEELREQGVTDTEILEYIIYHYLTGDDAIESLESASVEFED